MKIRVTYPRFTKRVQSVPGSGNLKPVQVRVPYHLFDDSSKVSRIKASRQVESQGDDQGLGITVDQNPLWDLRRLRMQGTLYTLSQQDDSFHINHEVTVTPPSADCVIKREPTSITYEMSAELKPVACIEVDHAVHVDLPYTISKVASHDLHQQLNNDQVFYGTRSSVKDDVFQDKRANDPEQYVEDILSARSKHVTVFYGHVGKCQVDKYAIVHLLSLAENIIKTLPNVIDAAKDRLVIYIDGTGLHPYPATMAEGSGVGYANADYIVIDAQHVQNGIFDPAPLKKLMLQGIVKKRLHRADGLLLEYMWPFFAHLLDKTDSRFYQNCVTLFQHPEDIAMNQYVAPGLFMAYLKTVYGSRIMWDVTESAIILHANEEQPGVHLLKHLLSSTAKITSKAKTVVYAEYLASLIQMNYFRSDNEVASILKDLVKSASSVSYLPVECKNLTFFSFTRRQASKDIPHLCFAVVKLLGTQEVRDVKSQLEADDLAWTCFVKENKTLRQVSASELEADVQGEYLVGYAYV